MPGRIRRFCSAVPRAMSVGPTLFRVSSGSGTPAQCDSSTKIIWSMGPRAWPPYSTGQPESQPTVLAHAADVVGVGGSLRVGGLDLLHQGLKVPPELVLQTPLLCREFQVQGFSPVDVLVSPLGDHYRKILSLL